VSVWGALAERYEVQPGVEPPPRKLLALDGGGIRGILTLEVLLRIERLLAEATGEGEKFRLCDFFDYIGGTSTGAIIAAGLARGMSAGELLAFYEQAGPAMFKQSGFLRRLRYFYRSQPLAEKLKETFGEQTNLLPENLRCLLLVVTRNVTTDSPWPISSNPLATYNDPSRRYSNLKIPLWQLVRASTAAPVFFAPEVLKWDPDDPTKTFKFEDGGLTPYNNPAFLLSRMATQAPYKLNWKTGERNLLLVSVGTGAAPRLDANVYSKGNILGNVRNLPSALMYGAQVDQDINCRMVGRCVYGDVIDRELGDLIPRDENGNAVPLSQNLGRAFLYTRYNADLSSRWLNERGLGEIDPSKVAKLDSTDHIDALRRIGRWVGEEVKLEHFGPFVGR
jgi:hypothetical protein